MKRAVFALGIVFAALVASAQDIQVNRENKTISITADESATANAEVATLAIGYHNFAPTQEAAYRDNLVVAEQITKALLGAKVPKENVETDKLRLGRTEAEEKWTEEMKKERRFEAQQSWHVTASSSDAQGLVDLVVKAGANEVEDVEWNVADPLALQAKASGAALAKARAIAEQMAKGLGTKLGELVYASNRAPVARAYRYSTIVNTEAASLSNREPKLRLFPQKVKSDATVFAVFAIE